MKFIRSICFYTTLSLTTLMTVPVQAGDLPELGDSASGYVSLQQEYVLGRVWLRQLRAQTDTINDPLLTTFLENLIFRLIPHSGVRQSDFEFVVVDNASLNAFAVPGGIIGINYGLLLYTRDEDEISAVLAHELAHLSQRHFSRQIEQAERQQPVAIATLLASILLIATNNTDAGFAGLMTSQAASIQSQLAYSRDWEQEADRLGMKTLAEAGLDPNAMSTMFQQMLQASRFSSRPPEFLLTHPVTESRIAEAADRAQQYPLKPRLTSFEFLILKQGAVRRYQLSKDKEQTYFADIRRRNTRSGPLYAAASYSLAHIALEQQHWQQGMDYLQAIPSPWSQHPAVIALQARLLAAQGQTDNAVAAIDKALPFTPEDLLLLTTRADLLRQAKRADEAVNVLKPLSIARPTNPAVWQQLSETAADAGQQLLAYRANGEYLFFSGQQARALRQMEMALKTARQSGDFQQEAAINRRLQVMTAAPDHL